MVYEHLDGYPMPGDAEWYRYEDLKNFVNEVQRISFTTDRQKIREKIILITNSVYRWDDFFKMGKRFPASGWFVNVKDGIDDIIWAMLKTTDIPDIDWTSNILFPELIAMYANAKLSYQTSVDDLHFRLNAKSGQYGVFDRQHFEQNYGVRWIEKPVAVQKN